MTDVPIRNVSDTAQWVAAYRALESERQDALFRDPFARRLAGDRGFAIARNIPGSRIIGWSISVRTIIIDDFIHSALAHGTDTILNLGAGYDTRPYRMQLPSELRWIEVDYPALIETKDERLRDERPRCLLERIRLDLADRNMRRQMFDNINQQSRRVLVLTEGVLPYLGPHDVGALADDLRGQASFKEWIVDYFAPELLRWIVKSRTHRHMQQAPFKFQVDDWHGFFAAHGWQQRELVYLDMVGQRLGRRIPLNWWLRLLFAFAPRARKEAFHRMRGFAVLEPMTVGDKK